MYFGGFLRNLTAITLAAGLGRSVSTSLYSSSFPLNRIESLPSNLSLTTTFCRRNVNEGRVRTNVQLVHLMIYPLLTVRMPWRQRYHRGSKTSAQAGADPWAAAAPS